VTAVTETEEETTELLDTVQRRELDWQVEQMMAMGLTEAQAGVLVMEGVSWHEVADLIDRGCPPGMVAQIA